MKKVRINQKKSISRKTTLFFMLLLLAIALIIFLLSRPASFPQPEPMPDTRVMLFEATAEELISFTIKPFQEMEYTIVKQNNDYKVEGYPYYDLNQEIIEKMVDTLIYLEASDTLGNYTEEKDIDLEMFGLGEDALEVTARFTDNRSYTLRIGSRIPGDIPSDYGMILDSPMLYAVSITMRDEFDYPLNRLHNLPAINFNPDLLEAVRFEEGLKSLVLRRISDEVWVMEQPFSYPVSADKIEIFKENVGKMRFASFVDLESMADLRSYGLDQPRMRIIFDLAPSTITEYSPDLQSSTEHSVEAQQIVIEIGNPLGEGIGFYCLYNGTVYQATNLSMGFMLDTNAANYLSVYPLGWPLNRLDSINIVSKSGQNFLYHVELVEDIQLNNEVSTNAQGEILYQFAFRDGNDRDVEPEQIIQLYKSLASIRATGAVEASYSTKALSPELEVYLQFGMFSRYVKFYPYDALHAAIEVDGTILFYTDLAYLNEAEAVMSGLSGK